MVQLGSSAEPRPGTGLMGSLYGLLLRMGSPLRPLRPSETPCPLLWASWMLTTLPSPVVTLATDHLLPERASLPPSHRNGSASPKACSTLLLQDGQPAAAILTGPQDRPPKGVYWRQGEADLVSICSLVPQALSSSLGWL